LGLTCLILITGVIVILMVMNRRKKAFRRNATPRPPPPYTTTNTDPYMMCGGTDELDSPDAVVTVAGPSESNPSGSAAVAMRSPGKELPVMPPPYAGAEAPAYDNAEKVNGAFDDEAEETRERREEPDEALGAVGGIDTNSSESRGKSGDRDLDSSWF